jgi:ABC-2 type transport system permease protein
MSRALLRKVRAVRALDLTQMRSSVEEASRILAAGEAEGILVIDAHLERDILRGEQGRITLMAGGGFLGRASTVLQGLSDAIAAFSRDAVVAQARFEGAPATAPISLVQRPLFNTREGYASGVVTGVAVLIVQQTLAMGIVLLAATRRERRGRLQFTRMELAGWVSAFWVLGVLNLLYYEGFVFWFHDFPHGGNLWGLLLSAGFYIAAVISCAGFVGSFFHVRERAMQIILMTAMPLYFLAGLSWPVTSMPVWLVWIGKLVPSTAGINAMVKCNEMGAHVDEVLPELANLLVLIALYGSLMLWRYLPAKRAPHPLLQSTAIDRPIAVDE